MKIVFDILMDEGSPILISFADRKIGIMGEILPSSIADDSHGMNTVTNKWKD